MHLPATGRVEPGRGGEEYLSAGLLLDQKILQGLLRDLPTDQVPPASRDFEVCEPNEEFAEAWLRMLRLLKTPRDIPALAPVYEREILYRVLMGPQGGHLRQLAMKESSLSQVSRAADWIRRHYKAPIDIAEIAAKTGMATTTFHRQFKSATGLSPVQYQKRLRLLEARNLLAFEGHAVASAAYEVGYQSPSQFNREYSRFFGMSPGRSAAVLRDAGIPGNR